MPKLSKVFTEKEHLDFLTQLGFDLEAGLESRHPKTNNFLLHEVIIAGHVDIVRILLKHGLNVNSINTDGKGLSDDQTPLLLAIYHKHPALCQLLLEKGADPQLRNAIDYSPLMKAAESDNLEILGLLVTANVDLNEENLKFYSSPYTAMMFAASRGKIDAAIFLIESGAKLLNSEGSEILRCGNLTTHLRLKASIQAYTEKTLTLQKELAQLAEPLPVIPTDIINLICSYTPGYSFITQQEGYYISPKIMAELEQIKRADFPYQISKENEEKEQFSNEPHSLQTTSSNTLQKQKLSAESLSKQNFDTENEEEWIPRHEEKVISPYHAHFLFSNNRRPLKTNPWPPLPSSSSPSRVARMPSINPVALWQDFRKKSPVTTKTISEAKSSKVSSATVK